MHCKLLAKALLRSLFALDAELALSEEGKSLVCHLYTITLLTESSLLGFFMGASISGYGAYYYLVDEYRAANNAVLADVVQLQNSIRRLEDHVAKLEAKVNKN